MTLSSYTPRNRVQIAGQYGVNRERAVTLEALSSDLVRTNRAMND
jgi:hypothetical protein